MHHYSYNSHSKNYKILERFYRIQTPNATFQKFPNFVTDAEL